MSIFPYVPLGSPTLAESISTRKFRDEAIERNANSWFLLVLELELIIPLLEMSDPGPSFREKCLLASRLVFQATDQYSAAVVFACAQLMSLADMCCKLRLSRQPCMHDARI